MANDVTHTLLLKKRTSLSNDLSYCAKLTEPISMRNKRLSYFSVVGFRNWLNDWEMSVLLDSANETECYFEIQIGENSREKVGLPRQIFLMKDFEFIADSLKTSLLGKLNEADFDLYVIKDNIFYFHIAKAGVSVRFSRHLCDYFGFNKDVVYDDRTLVRIFIRKRFFFDSNCEIIGVRTNFGFNPYFRFNCLSFFYAENIPWGGYFHEILIRSKENIRLKSNILEEIEVKFLNLSTEKVFSSVSYHPDYILVSVCFSHF